MIIRFSREEKFPGQEACGNSQLPFLGRPDFFDQNDRSKGADFLFSLLLRKNAAALVHG